MNYDSMKLIELKTLCKDRGLRVSGTKAEVIIRLMENDESKQPEPISISTPTQQAQMYQNQPVTQIIVHNNADVTLQLTGIGIILYGIFRMAIALLFNEWMPFESFLAMVIGLGYILGGALTVQSYKQGIYITLGVLAFSGVMSLIYHEEWSPLSIGMGGIWPPMFSLICSGVCMIIVATPLLGAMGGRTEFRSGSPPYLRNFLNAADYVSPLPLAVSQEEKTWKETKIVVKCVHCDSKLKVPSGYKGKVKCPTCKESFKVQ